MTERKAGHADAEKRWEGVYVQCEVCKRKLRVMLGWQPADLDNPTEGVDGPAAVREAMDQGWDFTQGDADMDVLACPDCLPKRH